MEDEWLATAFPRSCALSVIPKVILQPHRVEWTNTTLPHGPVACLHPHALRRRSDWIDMIIAPTAKLPIANDTASLAGSGQSSSLSAESTANSASAGLSAGADSTPSVLADAYPITSHSSSSPSSLVLPSPSQPQSRQRHVHLWLLHYYAQSTEHWLKKMEQAVPPYQRRAIDAFGCQFPGSSPAVTEQCACQPKRLAVSDALATLIQIGATVGRRAVRMRVDATRTEMRRDRRPTVSVSQQAPLLVSQPAPLSVSQQSPSSPPLPHAGTATSASTSISTSTSTSQIGNSMTRLEPLPTGTIAGLSAYWFAAHDGPVLSTAPAVLLLLASKNATASSSPVDALARLRAAERSILAQYGQRPFVVDAGFLLRVPPPLAEVRRSDAFFFIALTKNSYGSHTHSFPSPKHQHKIRIEYHAMFFRFPNSSWKIFFLNARLHTALHCVTAMCARPALLSPTFCRRATHTTAAKCRTMHSTHFSRIASATATSLMRSDMQNCTRVH